MKNKQRLGLEQCEQRCLLTINFEYHAVAAVETIGEIASADMDGDGDLDIVVGSESGVVFQENQGRFKTFTAHRIGTGKITEVQPIDMDTDEDLDLYVRFENGRYAWYEQLSPGQFADNALSTFPFEAFGDIDNDGDVDAISLVELTFAWHETTDKEIGVGPRHNVEVHVLPADSSSDDLAEPPIIDLVDLDGDGDLDILATPPYRASWLAWYENQDGLGNFAPKHDIRSAAAARTTLRDFDEDGHIDILLVTGITPNFSQTILIETTGNGEFQETVLFDERPNDFELHDLDGDGLEDLVTFHGQRLKLAYRQRNANGITFGDDLNPINLRIQDRSIFFGDLDGDGDLDILAASPQAIGWYDSDPTEQRAPDETSNEDESRLDADANDDGIVDFLDFLAVANNFGFTDADRTKGDFDEDGAVTFLDFLVLANRFWATNA